MTAASSVALAVEGVIKVYPGTVALKGVDFEVHRGAVNVLVGENGAGKSTLMKIIAGVEQPTEGRILMDGKDVTFASTEDAVKQGIGIVFQEMNLFANLSVAENVFVSREIIRGIAGINHKEQERRTAALLRQLEHDIDPKTLVADLPIGQQQIVEIAKALAQQAQILIMDEPTSALSAAEVEILFRVIADLKSRGVAIVYISHRLEELIRIGDYITVLRDGRITGHERMSAIDVPWIVRQMIGSDAKDFAKAEGAVASREVFRAEAITLPRVGGGLLVDNVALSVRAGEILGIYGLMGAGRTELLECIIGRHPHARGEIYIGGQRVSARDVTGRIRHGLALIPEDRQRHGLVPILSIASNMTLASLGRFCRFFHIRQDSEDRAARGFIRDLSIKAPEPAREVSSLSGGNQQKVVIAKALMTAPKVLLMDEPSRGIDIGAKADVFRTMRRLAAEGLGILFVTSDLEEVMALSDRIAVMSNGKLIRTFDRAEATEEVVVAASAAGHGVTEHHRNQERAS
ncbi:MAG TPA: sugar ABC transporter ATP-binding protein [Dongiaceae bacterium]|nr:sugar ABC transporter ATP-binding protein [Dongiaceae bacterium]